MQTVLIKSLKWVMWYLITSMHHNKLSRRRVYQTVFLYERIQMMEVVVMARMVPMGMDFWASCKSPDRFDPAMIPVQNKTENRMGNVSFPHHSRVFHMHCKKYIKSWANLKSLRQAASADLWVFSTSSFKFIQQNFDKTQKCPNK